MFLHVAGPNLGRIADPTAWRPRLRVSQKQTSTSGPCPKVALLAPFNRVAGYTPNPVSAGGGAYGLGRVDGGRREEHEHNRRQKWAGA